MKVNRRILATAVVAVLLAAAGLATVLKSGPKGLEVEVLKASRGDVSPVVTADGLVAAKDTVNLSSQIMGEIVALPFPEGARVKKGDVLVRINPDTFQRDVDSARANLTAAETATRQASVTLDQRKRDWERARDLFEKGIFSTAQRDDARLALDQAELAVRSASAQAAQARAYLQKAEDNLAKTVLRSPLDGVVTAVNAKVGETAVVGTMNFAGTVILTVSDLSEIITEVEVDEADYTRLRLGQEATVTVDALGGQKYAGKVVEIGASAHAASASLQSNIRQFKVKVRILDPGGELKPGVTARVRLMADRREKVLRVPLGAVRTEEKSGQPVYFVFVNEKGKAAKKVIQTGLSDDLYTEVLSGLDEGAEVVTGPYRILRTLKEGDRLKAKPVKAEDFERHQSSAPKSEEP